jgi:hypothetical protein
MTGLGDPQNPTPDQAAAHEFLSELRTRITTQPLPYQYGVEARALESLWEVFAQAREAMKKHPGCVNFAGRTTDMLNTQLRPVTAKWHRAHQEGRLKSRDGAHEFRADLADVQAKLRAFAAELHEMAYGTRGMDALTPEPMTQNEVQDCLADLPFGIVSQHAVKDETIRERMERTFKEINKDEAEAVAARRGKHGLDTAANNAVGLGLSGGGIRSATFCLGVVQVLAERRLLNDVDFLSTVSGGGYTGSFLTRRLGKSEPSTDVAGPHGPDPAPIRYLRQHAKYLSAYNLKQRWSMVTAVLAGMVLNWTAPLFLLALTALVAVFIPDGVIPWIPMLLAASAMTALCLIVYAFGMRQSPPWGGGLLGIVAAATVFLAALWLLTWAYARLPGGTAGWSIAGLVAAFVAAFPTIVRFLPILKKPEVRRLVLKVALILAAFVVPLGAIGLCFWFYSIGSAPTHLTWQGTSLVIPKGYLLAGLTVLFGLIACFLLDVNLTGPHRLYRDLLARTFIHFDESDTNPVPLKDINPQGSAPYHLINATVNLPSSESVVLRERKSDFFLFSKYWCGAPSVGYHKTDQWRANDAPVDLATAMAVSGAAASSYMGLGSMPTLTALLTFLNVRLGYWIRRPLNSRLLARPGFLCLMREMIGVAMSENQSWINLSDGGHIENMAVYELLRRRCKFIISIDGEADPRSTFEGHLTLVRHAQIDFGIRIEPDLTDLRPDLTTKFSQSHSMMCRVRYPAVGGPADPAADRHPAGQGLILYLKLSVTGNELEPIKRYRRLNPDFPHQTTLDQFFDEEQFETYRQLGVHVAEGLFSSALLGSKQRPATVAEWFGALARNLLLSGK